MPIKWKDLPPLSRFVKTSWTNMNIRCGRYTHLRTKSKCRTYEGIEVLVSRSDFKQWCEDQADLILSLNKPSIDRLDKTKHYELSNMQIIELTENIRKDSTKFTDTHGVCCKCEQTKTIDEFVKDRRRSNGRISICKPCEAIRSRKKYRASKLGSTGRK